MSNTLNHFQKLLEKYKFQTPVSDEVQHFVVQSTHQDLKTILKKQGEYTIYFGFLLLIIVWCKRLGIQVGFMMARVISALIIVGVGTAGVGAGYGVKRYFEVNKPRQIQEIKTEGVHTSEVQKDTVYEDHKTDSDSDNNVNRDKEILLNKETDVPAQKNSSVTNGKGVDELNQKNGESGSNKKIDRRRSGTFTTF